MKKIYNNIAFIILSLSFTMNQAQGKSQQLDILAAKPEPNKKPSKSYHKPSLRFLDDGFLASNESIMNKEVDFDNKTIRFTLNGDTMEKVKQTMNKYDETKMAFLVNGQPYFSETQSYKTDGKDTLELKFSNSKDFLAVSSILN